MTHWLVAGEVKAGLAGTAYDKPLEDNPNCLLLGAIWPDVLFYLRGRSHPGPLFDLPDKLHGLAGHDSFQTLRFAVQAAARAPNRAGLAAFVVGLISHIFADAVFHPMVFFFTGDNNSPEPRVRTKAVQSHREFEVVLDFFLCQGRDQIKGYSLRRILARTEIPLSGLAAASGLDRISGCSRAETVRALTSALRLFGLLRSICLNPFSAQCLAWIKPVLPDNLKEVASLAYAPQLERLTNMLAGPINYRHPVTGQALCRSVKDLAQEAVARSLDQCRLMEEALLTGRPLDLNGPGPSLDSGLAPARDSRMKYFAPQPMWGPMTD